MRAMLLIGTVVAVRTVTIMVVYMGLELPICIMVVDPMAMLSAATTGQLLAWTIVSMSGLLMRSSGVAGMIIVFMLKVSHVVLAAIALLATVAATTVGIGLLMLRLMSGLMLREGMLLL